MIRVDDEAKCHSANNRTKNDKINPIGWWVNVTTHWPTGQPVGQHLTSNWRVGYNRSPTRESNPAAKVQSLSYSFTRNLSS